MRPATAPDLTADFGRRSVCHLLPRFIAMDAKLWLRRQRQRLGWLDLADVAPEALRFPDTALCKQALALAQEVSQTFLFRHAARSFQFAALFGGQDRVRFDPELLFLACILHDLGLTDAYAGPRSFEWEGADAAHAFCLDHGCSKPRAWVVREAIALHAAVGFAPQGSPEGALLHFGAGADVIGLRLDEVPAGHLRRMLEEHPREDFANQFAELLAREAAAKPHSHIAGHVALGFGKRQKNNNF
jgi:hypothetical protein